MSLINYTTADAGRFSTGLVIKGLPTLDVCRMTMPKSCPISEFDLASFAVYLLVRKTKAALFEYSRVLIEKMPGVKCPTCAARGIESWVLSGKNCPKCGHPC